MSDTPTPATEQPEAPVFALPPMALYTPCPKCRGLLACERDSIQPTDDDIANGTRTISCRVKCRACGAESNTHLSIPSAIAAIGLDMAGRSAEVDAMRGWEPKEKPLLVLPGRG